MSEYQFYEFAAIDGPISDEGLKYARGCSSRANVSRVRWQNTYSFGDFRGSVDTMLKYYDVHFYIANWGTVCLALALPRGGLPSSLVQPYLRGDKGQEPTLRFKETGERCIVSWERHEEGGWGWTEGDGLIDPLIGVREELMRGDVRSLFLGWLSDFDSDECQDPKRGAIPIPPIPPGLNQLSPAQEALIAQFPVDPDALAVAAELSSPEATDRIPMATALDRLSVPEMRALLGRVAEGGGPGVMAELNRLTLPQVQASVGATRSCFDFARQVIEARGTRRKREAEAAAAAKRRKEESRRLHLTDVMKRAATLWSGLDPLMDQKISSAYDQVANQLQELRDAYSQTGDSAGFNRKIAEFRDRYAKRPAMLRRIKKL